MTKRLKRSGVMLAHPATTKRLAAFPDKFLCQPKYNGERCRVVWYDGEPFFISSYGNEFKFLDHLKKEILDYRRGFLREPEFDGEIYVHGWKREDIHSAVSRKVTRKEEVEQLEFHIFDMNNPQLLQIDRTIYLGSTSQLPCWNKIKFVPTSWTTQRLWEEKALQYIEDGYEGIILRHPDSLYQEKRVPTLLKFKPTEFDDYEIVGVKPGTGWCEGMLGAFMVKGEDSTTFYVGTGPELTKENRIKYWKIRDELLGKKLRVKHEPIKTRGGFPVCTVAMEVIFNG